MIGYIKGTVLSSDGTNIVLQTKSDIGYEVYFNHIIPLDQELELFTSFIVRENSQTLFGFSTIEEKKLFELLLDVNGVGPKSAYSLVFNVGLENIQQAIELENNKLLTQAPGIGKKTADQIILSLKDKITKFNVSSLKFKKVPEMIQVTQNYSINEAIQALEGLGYKAMDVMPPIKSNFKEGMSSEELLKKVLRDL